MLGLNTTVHVNANYLPQHHVFLAPELVLAYDVLFLRQEHLQQALSERKNVHCSSF
ncbi:hypothetical protein A2U01_0094169, partial [Trifolium medium]|nr:hypothetical protein [Trifolium medium]